MWSTNAIIPIMAIIINTATYTKSSQPYKMHGKQPFTRHTDTTYQQQCPRLYARVFTDSVPQANLSAGVYTPYGSSNSRPVPLRECVLACCFTADCNVALLTGGGACYHVACASSEQCLPQSQSNSAVGTSMVLVRPVERMGPSWAGMLPGEESSEQQQQFHDAFDSAEVDVTTESIAQLHVMVESKQVQLPEDNVTLEAHVISNDEDSMGTYQYEWITLQQPDAELKGPSGAIRNQQENRLILSHLAQGLYMFNVTVSGASAVGWTLANVTVLGAVRVNAPPTIIIMPTNQTVRLPNTAAILDASATTDDADGADMVQYRWELQQGPLGYEPSLPNAATLQLTDLTRVGQYTFQVSAADRDGAQSKALAYVTVLPPIDYPPTADAGPDQVLYLPLNDGELVLSGNGSTDDHEIVSWEWTRINNADTNNTLTNTDTNMQAVDMRDTRTPTLHLGRIIEAGVYTFQLRVGDATNQTSTAQVRLFIKEKDDAQVAPPPPNTSTPAANATLTTHQPVVRVNTRPRAVATIADSNVQLPRNVIYLNASQSSDDDDGDVIVSYVWRTCTAHNDSVTAATLGVGAVAEGTDRHPVLVLVLGGVRGVGVVGMRACWNVTVCDVGGLCDWAAVRFSVAPDPMLEFMVEIVVGVVGDASTYLTIAEYDTLLQSIASSIDDSSQTIQMHVRPSIGNTVSPEHTLITLYATTTTNDTPNATITLTAGRFANLLQRTLSAGPYHHVMAVRPASCLSVKCSGHGRCDPDTRTCHCHPLWMPNVVSHDVTDDWGGWGRDCSWSVLYVTLACVALVSVVLCLVYAVWNVLCSWGGGGGVGAVALQTHQKQHHRRSRVRNSHSYTLIDNALGDGRAGGGGVKRQQRSRRLDSDSEDRVDDSADSDRDDNVVFSSLNDKLQYK